MKGKPMNTNRWAKLRSLLQRKMQRIATKDVTDTLALAMENADRMKHCLIIYETIEGESCAYGFMSNEEADLKTANYMCDIFKSYVLQNFAHED